jgi:single-stranded DNA-binding protein
MSTKTIVGKLTTDPEIRYTSQGQARCLLRVDTTGSSTWHPDNIVDVETVGELAENCALSMQRGTRVVLADLETSAIVAGTVGVSLEGCTVEINTTVR